MKLCPIAIVAGCKKCPAFNACPLKGVLGDYEKDADKAKIDRKQTGSAAATEAKDKN